MKEEKIQIINAENERLVGIYTRPSVNKPKYATVVLVHGFGLDMHESGMFDDLAAALTESGIQVYRFDFSGCGESEGDFSETSLTKLCSDLNVVLEYVSAQEQVDDTRIGILGQCFGTSVILALQPLAKAVIFMGSIAHPKQVLSNFLGEGYNPEGVSERLRSSGETTRIKPQFWEDLDKYDLEKCVSGINAPILFFHRSLDTISPLSEMEALYQNATSLHEKVIIEGTGHGFHPYREKVYAIAKKWFKKYLL